MTEWIIENYIEILGAAAGMIYVVLEIRQDLLLWPLGIMTAGFYIVVFYTSRFYAGMGLQVYYLAVSIAGWYWWKKGINAAVPDPRDEGIDVAHGKTGSGNAKPLEVSRLGPRTGFVLATVFVILYLLMWIILSRLTDSPVPGWDSFITSLSVVATWMLARKIYEHWYLWMVANLAAVLIFYSRGLYPTMVLYGIYLVMSSVGLKTWSRSLPAR